MGGPIDSESVGDESVRVDVVEDMEERGRGYFSSTPEKNASGVENVADSSKFPSESPLKRSAGVAFKISEEEELLCEVKWLCLEKEERNQMMVMAVKWRCQLVG